MSKTKNLTTKEKWLRYPYRLAHHPICSHFDDHVYMIKGLRICRGCVNMYSGVLIGIILAPIAVFVLQINFWVAFATTNVLYIFTPISIIFNPPRIIKDISRLLLGVALISSLLSIVLSVVRLVEGLNYGAISVIIITFSIYLSSRFYFSRLRDKRNENVCRNCEQFYLPRCDGMRQREENGKSAKNQNDISSEQ